MIEFKNPTKYDEQDKEIVNKYTWFKDSHGYMATNLYVGGRRKLLRMHQVLLHVPKGLEVDHINGDRLDARRENLRIVTRSQNQMNRSVNQNASSKYKGVGLHKLTQKWIAQIGYNGKRIYKRIYIGLFDSERHAAMAYDINAKALFGEFSKLNFT